MKLKSDVSVIFRVFKDFVENQFNCKIQNFYSNNGGEFLILKYFFSKSWHFPSHHTPSYSIY